MEDSSTTTTVTTTTTTSTSGSTADGYTVGLFLGCFRYCWIRDIYPVADPCCGIILNACLPGVGTMWQACQYPQGFNCSTFLLGWYMTFTSEALFGWYWAIWHACQVQACSIYAMNNGITAADYPGSQLRVLILDQQDMKQVRSA